MEGELGCLCDSVVVIAVWLVLLFGILRGVPRRQGLSMFVFGMLQLVVVIVVWHLRGVLRR